jgi:hypothetical protein
MRAPPEWSFHHPWHAPDAQNFGAMQMLLQLPQLLLSAEVSTQTSLQTRNAQLAHVPALQKPLQH